MLFFFVLFVCCFVCLLVCLFVCLFFVCLFVCCLFLFCFFGETIRNVALFFYLGKTNVLQILIENGYGLHIGLTSMCYQDSFNNIFRPGLCLKRHTKVVP